MNWLFAHDANSGKVKVYSEFYVSVVKNENCHLINETLRSAVS